MQHPFRNKFQWATGMDFVQLPSELFARILNLTDVDTAINLRCTCRDLSNLIISVRDLISLEHPLQEFIASLPVIEGAHNFVQEENIASFDVIGQPLQFEQHSLCGRGREQLRRNVQYTSIRVEVPKGGSIIALNIGGFTVMRLDKLLLQIMRDEDGFVELMDLMRYLPDCFWHNINIDYAIDVNTLTVYTAFIERTVSIPNTIHTWKILGMDDVYQDESVIVAKDSVIVLRLSSNFISLGHVVVIKQGDKLVTDCLSSLKLHVDGQSSKPVIASAAKIQSIPAELLNCPISIHDCYYLQMSEKVNCSKVQHMLLELEFCQTITASVTVYNLHKNFARASAGMLGVMFAN